MTEQTITISAVADEFRSWAEFGKSRALIRAAQVDQQQAQIVDLQAQIAALTPDADEPEGDQSGTLPDGESL